MAVTQTHPGKVMARRPGYAPLNRLQTLDESGAEIAGGSFIVLVGFVAPSCCRIPISSELPHRSLILPSPLNLAICTPRALIFLPVAGMP